MSASATQGGILFNGKYSSVNKMYSLVSEIWKFRKLNLKTSVSNMWTTIGYWTSCQCRQLGRGAWGSTDPKKWKVKIYIIDSISLWYSCCNESTATHTAELMSLRVAQTTTQCLRFCWCFLGFHKEEQNFIKNFYVKISVRCKTVINGILSQSIYKF